MERVILESYKGSTFREQKSLYIYFDHKFKVSQVIHPNMDKFNGDWKKLADAVTESTFENPKYYKFEIR